MALAYSGNICCYTSLASNVLSIKYKRSYLTATFLPNTRSFALVLFPPPDRTFLSAIPSALSLFFKSEGLAANFTRFAFAGTSPRAGSETFFEDLRMVFVSEGFSSRGFDLTGAESLEPDDLGVTDLGETSVSFVETSIEESGVDFFTCGLFEEGGFVGGGEADFEGCEEVALDFFFFFCGSSSNSRVRFSPFFTPSSVLSGIGTRVKPSHLPPSSSSSPQLHIGRLALELVLMCID